MRRITKTRVLLALLVLGLIAELAATALVIGVSKARGNLLDFVLCRLWITRPFYTSPVERHSKARFVGYHVLPGVMRELGRSDPILGWRLGRSVGVISYFDEGRRVGWGVTNDQGFASSGEVDVHYEVPKPRGTYRVVVLGGSTVEGITPGLAPEHGLTACLQRALRRELAPRNVEVVNAGVSGFYSGQELLYLQTELLRYEPDLVIVYDGWNETRSNAEFDKGARDRFERARGMYDRLGQRLDDTYRFWPTLANLAVVALHRAHEVLDRTALFFLARRAFEIALARASAAGPEMQLTAPTKHYPETVRGYIANLHAMVDVCARAKVPIALFFQPVLGMGPKTPAGPEITYLQQYTELMRIRGEFYRDARPAYARFAAERSKAGEVCVTDLSEIFAPVRERIYEDSGHLMPEGNRIVADAIMENLGRCGTLRR